MTSMQKVLGSIVSLWRYPAKSMMGEELNAAEVTKDGLLGDRAYALLDSLDGKVAGAKNPRKWPTLFDFRAVLADATRAGVKVSLVRVALPEGTIVNSEQPDVHRTLSDVLKREVTLSACLIGARLQLRNTGRILRASTTAIPSPTLVCLTARLSTVPSCIY